MAWSIFTDGGGDSAAVVWAASLLTAINAPLTTENLKFVYDWEKSEGGGGKNNPLNQGPVPGQASLTSTGQQFGGGAADYVSPQAGISGAQAYLNMANFVPIRNALQANDANKARSALIASPWASSHYNGGANFSNAALPAGAQGSLTPAQLIAPVAGFPTNGMDAGAVVSGVTGITGSASSPDCLWSFPTINVGIGNIGGACILTVSEGHAIVGALLLLSGAVVGLVGLALLFKANPLHALPSMSRGVDKPDSDDLRAINAPVTKRPPERSFTVDNGQRSQDSDGQDF